MLREINQTEGKILYGLTDLWNLKIKKAELIETGLEWWLAGLRGGRNGDTLGVNRQWDIEAEASRSC